MKSPRSNGTIRLHNSGILERRIWYPEIVLDAAAAPTIDMWQRGAIFAEIRDERVTSFSPPYLYVSIDEDVAHWQIVVPRHRIEGVVYDASTSEPVEGARVIHDSDLMAVTPESRPRGSVRVHYP